MKIQVKEAHQGGTGFPGGDLVAHMGEGGIHLPMGVRHDRDLLPAARHRVTVTTGDGASVTFGEGDLVVFPEGLSCTWTIHSPVRKRYSFD